MRTAFHNVLDILSPLIAALILAYVISPIINFIEQRIIARLFARHGKTQSVRCKKLVRALLILLTYVAMLFALYGLIATLIPELFSSITNIVSNFSNYTYHDSMRKATAIFQCADHIHISNIPCNPALAAFLFLSKAWV